MRLFGDIFAFKFPLAALGQAAKETIVHGTRSQHQKSSVHRLFKKKIKKRKMEKKEFLTSSSKGIGLDVASNLTPYRFCLSVKRLME